MKGLLNLVAGGTVLAGLFLALAAALLVVVVIPGGWGILGLEVERLKRGIGRWL